MPAPPNIDFTTTGPNAENSSAIASRSKLGMAEHDPEKWGPVFGQDHAQENYSAAAGVSWTDSPQPQAPVWLGLLKTNVADNLSVLKSISVPSRNSKALGSTRILTPLSSTTSSLGAIWSAYSTV